MLVGCFTPYYILQTIISEKIVSQFKKYRCQECEFVYDEAMGYADSGFPPGTLWSEIPDDWDCPICGAPKSFFKEIKE